MSYFGEHFWVRPTLILVGARGGAVWTFMEMGRRRPVAGRGGDGAPCGRDRACCGQKSRGPGEPGWLRTHSRDLTDLVTLGKSRRQETTDPRRGLELKLPSAQVQAPNLGPRAARPAQGPSSQGVPARSQPGELGSFLDVSPGCPALFHHPAWGHGAEDWEDSVHSLTPPSGHHDPPLWKALGPQLRGRSWPSQGRGEPMPWAQEVRPRV